jgi:hypothetical protein
MSLEKNDISKLLEDKRQLEMRIDELQTKLLVLK